ncbi:uncharacterized protein LOC126910130, partial [Daktulosphaira vitifoliae]|uniref:uncharacterized protein LOC126910130 n=1 Tax=Daktulosphaira vitifoliae TaxID=58002 RepID=UPI0021A9D464
PVASLHEEDSYDDMLSNAVQQMWKNGLRNLKKKLAFNTARGNQNYVQFSISTYCYSNGTCTIRQAPCSCEINDNDETLGNVKPSKNIINQGKSQKTTTKIPLTTLISKKQKVQNNKTTNIPPITPSSKKKKVQNNEITKRPLITQSTTQHKVQNKKTTTKPPVKSTQSNKLIGGLTNFEINNIRKQHLEQTNKLRAKHGAKKLSINDKVRNKIHMYHVMKML